MGLTEWLVAVLCVLQLVNFGLNCFFGGRLRKIRRLAIALRRKAAEREQKANYWNTNADDADRPADARAQARRFGIHANGSAFAYHDAANDIDALLANGAPYVRFNAKTLETP